MTHYDLLVSDLLVEEGCPIYRATGFGKIKAKLMGGFSCSCCSQVGLKAVE